MASIRIEQPHALPLDDVRTRLADFEANLAKVGARLDWAGPKAVIKGIGVSGDVIWRPDAVVVDLKLGFMAKAAGVDPARLEGAIRKRLAAALT